jgi:hypothetical protein
MGDGFITDISLSVKPSTPWVLNLSIFNTLGELLSPENAISLPPFLVIES